MNSKFGSSLSIRLHRNSDCSDAFSRYCSQQFFKAEQDAKKFRKLNLNSKFERYDVLENLISKQSVHRE